MYMHISIYIYIYIYIWRLRPCRRPPWMQGTAGWLTAELGYFLDLQRSFWRPWGFILDAWSDHFGDRGIQGSPNRHLEFQVCIFYDFRIIWGVPWEWLGAPFCDFSVIRCAKMGDRFQVHVLGDPGMEMMSESSGCLCYKHSKNNGVSDISHFPLIQ